LKEYNVELVMHRLGEFAHKVVAAAIARPYTEGVVREVGGEVVVRWKDRIEVVYHVILPATPVLIAKGCEGVETQHHNILAIEECAIAEALDRRINRNATRLCRGIIDSEDCRGKVTATIQRTVDATGRV
jgi:hypothetical protein